MYVLGPEAIVRVVMTSPTRNFFPVGFTRQDPGTESPYNVGTSELFAEGDKKNGQDDTSSGNFLERWRCCFAEPELDFYKLFYFFFHAATALFAYLPLYYKETVLLDHHHVGFLMGIRPFCRVLGAPLLGTFADKFNRYKSTLYAGLLIYIAIYMSITFVGDVPNVCGVRTKVNITNVTHRNAASRDINNGHKPSSRSVSSNHQGDIKMAADDRRTLKRNKRGFRSNYRERFVSDDGGGEKSIESQRRISVGERKRFSYRLLKYSSTFLVDDPVSRKVQNSHDANDYDYDYDSSKPDPRFLENGQKRTVDERYRSYAPDSRLGNQLMANRDEQEHEIVTNNVELNYDNLTSGLDRTVSKWWDNLPETAGENAWPYDVYRGGQNNKDQPEQKQASQRIFTILLLLTILAEFVGAPIDTLADTATLQSLKKEPQRYGHQRVWASIGFGLMSVVAGSVLHYTITTEEDVHGCPTKMIDRYRPVFYSCCSLLLLAFFTSFKFRFRVYEGQDTSGCSFWTCAKYFKTLDYSLFAFLAWFTGLAAGVTDSFLFVHLIHLGATPIVLVVVTTVRCVSEVIFFCLSPMLLVKYGHFPVIYAGLASSFVTFFYYSFLKSPWVVVPIELLCGLSSSAVWAALVSYVGAPPKVGATLQGMLHAVHIGMGQGIGGLFGGMIIASYGFDELFRSFSFSIAVVLLVVICLRYWRKADEEPIYLKLWDYSPIASNQEFSDEDVGLKN